MPDALTIYYDYTCGYSYRATHWADRLRDASPDLEIRWATFSLKEVNRGPDDPEVFPKDGAPTFSILALALAHAARGADFDLYHRTLFEAMHGEHRKVEAEELLQIAADAGVDVGAFEAIRGSWVARVRDEHYDAVERLKVYGTPTLAFGPGSVYLRLKEATASPDEAVTLLEGLRTVASSPATDLAEVFRPEGPVPTPVEVSPRIRSD